MFLSVPLFRYTLTAVRRDRVAQLMCVMLVLGAAVSLFLGGAATIEQQQYTLAMAGTVLRLVAVTGIVIFVSFFMRRAFDSREIDYLLATPLTRHRLLYSFSAAFVVVAAALALAVSAVMAGLAGGLSSGLALWSASVLVEFVITAMMALFFSAVLTSATISALCAFGFYTLSRLMGMMIGIIEAKTIFSGLAGDFMHGIVNVLAVVVPRFDLLAQSAWIVYGDAHDFIPWVLPVQAIVFVTLFFFCAAFDLRRNQF